MPESTEPPQTAHATWVAVYWFLRTHGGHWEFRTQYELADAIGVHPSVVTRLKQAAIAGRADWLAFTKNSIALRPIHRPPVE